MEMTKFFSHLHFLVLGTGVEVRSISANTYKRRLKSSNIYNFVRATVNK